MSTREALRFYRGLAALTPNPRLTAEADRLAARAARRLARRRR